jgi:hypothetical protein
MIGVAMFLSLMCVSQLTPSVISTGDWMADVDERMPQLYYKTFGYSY